MTERVSQGREIIKKIDTLTETVGTLSGDIKSLQMKVEMQPQIDQKTFDAIRADQISHRVSNDERFIQIEKRQDKTEENITWLVRLVVAIIIGIIIEHLFIP